ncbi:hypothetical protein [Mesorhizobium sp. M0968]|uniref:hypothetical protein n=1 Tax=Mesorhizobium sp. M0968 TaxID=2957037 RepID=UPI003336A106
MKQMKTDQIPLFVQDIVALGCEICAVGDFGYVIGDADLSLHRLEAIQPQLRRLDQTYGCRRHLKRQIVAYLNSVGRYVDPAEDSPVMPRH